MFAVVNGLIAKLPDFAAFAMMPFLITAAISAATSR